MILKIQLKKNILFIPKAIISSNIVDDNDTIIVNNEKNQIGMLKFNMENEEKISFTQIINTKHKIIFLIK